MSDLTFEDVNNADDLYEVIFYLSGVISDGRAHDLCTMGTVRIKGDKVYPSAEDLEWMVDLDGDDECFFEDQHRLGCTCQIDTVRSEQYLLFDARHVTGRVRFAPCPQRGTHERLNECWACWMDVQDGLTTPQLALAPVLIDERW